MPIYEKNHINNNGYLEINRNYCNRLIDLLNLERKPVGIEFFYTKEEFEKSSLQSTTYKMAYCCYVEKASRIGLSVKTTLNNHYCDGATTALGLEDPHISIKSGSTYYSYGLYKTKGIARKVWSEVPAFPSNNIKLYGVGIAPLDKIKEMPDIIITIGNAKSMMRLIQGSLFEDGQRLNLNVSAMQGMCSEITVIPYLSGKMNISLLCPSTRTLAKWKDTDLAAGISYGEIDRLIEGIGEIAEK